MAESSYKSFAYQFDPLVHLKMTQGIYENMDTLVSSGRPHWLHFEKPSKNLQQKLSKKLDLPKPVRLILFAQEVRSRCVKFHEGFVLVVQGVQPSTMAGAEDFPTLRFWITPQGILSLSTGKIEAVYNLQKSLGTLSPTTPMTCFNGLLSDLIGFLEASVYDLDEELNKIESNFEYTEEATAKIMVIRQDIIYLRRYLLPQKEALVTLSTKIEFISESDRSDLKELSDSMLRQVETIEMLRERAVIIQDNLTNQIGEIANKRMYFLTIIMLIFTPAFFVMGLFSMYLPIPGMNDQFTWWAVVIFIFISSVGLFWLFKKKKWL